MSHRGPYRSVSLPDHRRHQARGPGTNGDPQGEGAPLPAHVIQDEALDAAQDYLGYARGHEGAQGPHCQDHPAVVHRGLGPPVQDGYEPPARTLLGDTRYLPGGRSVGR